MIFEIGIFIQNQKDGFLFSQGKNQGKDIVEGWLSKSLYVRKDGFHFEEKVLGIDGIDSVEALEINHFSLEIFGGFEKQGCLSCPSSAIKDGAFESFLLIQPFQGLHLFCSSDEFHFEISNLCNNYKKIFYLKIFYLNLFFQSSI